jgi:hypothetical protein
LAPTDKTGTARRDFTACAAIAASESLFHIYGIFLRLLVDHGSDRYFKADVAVRTYAEHLGAWDEMDRLGYDGVGFTSLIVRPMA